MKFLPRVLCVLLAGFAALWAGTAQADVTLLNVAYDVTRELYKDINRRLYRTLDKNHWRADRGRSIAWRVQQAGAVGGQRPGGRCGDHESGHRYRPAGALGRGACKTGASASLTTARPIPPPPCFWCARAIRKTSATGMIWPSRA
jgi:hypothetical protein